MKRLFKNILVITLVVVIFIITILQVLPKNENHILASLQDKHKYLEESTEKKIVFVGGSNLLFGLDSKLVEENLEGYDIVNMGLHAGLGLRFMLNDIKEYLKPGDIIVIAPEYDHFTGKLNGESVLDVLLKNVPSSIKNIDINNVFTIVKGAPEFLRGQIAGSMKSILLNNIDSNEIQQRKFVNLDGDLTSNVDKENIGVKASNNNLQDIDEEAIDFLNDFYEYALENDIKVYMSYPSLYEDQYLIWKDDISNLENKLSTELDIPIISKPEEYVFGSEEIFDTIYHLNGIGKERRSMIVARDLKLALEM